MWDLINNLISRNHFIPHGHCYLWKPGLVWLHLLSDLIIGLSYYSIPAFLIYFARKRQDMPFRQIFWLFGAFIVFCGTTHLMAIWTLWHPAYWLSGLLKAGTALVSLYTALQLGTVVSLALALPSPEQYKRAEAALKQANELLEQRVRERTAEVEHSLSLLQTTLEATADGILAIDLTGKIITYNQKFVDLWEVGDVIPQKDDYLVLMSVYQHLKDSDNLRLQVEREFSQPDVQSYLLLDLKNGKICERYSKPQFLGEQIVGRVISCRDITDRKRAEEALRAREREFASLAAAAPVGIFRTNAQSSTIYVNELWCDIAGMTREEAMGDGWVEALHPDDRMQVFQEWHYATQNQLTFKSEFRYQRPDGTITWCYVQAVAESNETGEVTGYVGTLTDISDRKQAEQELRAARDELEIRVQERTRELYEINATLEQLNTELQRSNRELEQFAYIASHDLQEPLRAVAGYTHFLAEEYQNSLDETAQEYIGNIIDGATRMRQLIQDLLAYSRVSTKGKPFSPTDCNHVLRQVFNNLQVLIAENNATIAYDSLPTVRVDKTQLVQLFQNLIGNAIKFRREEPPQIQIAAELRDEVWLFSVKDNGIGIKSKYLERIFQIFQRLHTRSEIPGTGIGLAICKKIVERHYGSIWAESEPGKGTTFFFTIPQ
jgi:PAS domain S-box-containing protein